jgi:hypothetical protein
MPGDKTNCPAYRRNKEKEFKRYNFVIIRAIDGWYGLD